MKKRILVIEDNLEVRENLVEILELSNYEVYSAENGKIGIEKALVEVPDLILCDVMMPVMDGYGVMKILRKNPSINHIPLIYLTAKSEKEDFRKGMSLGANDYIVKPFDDVELLEAIETRMERATKLKAIDNSDEGIQRFFSEAKAQDEFDKLSIDKEIRNFSSKAVIYEEGQLPRHLYFVISGEVKIFQTNDFGKELTINLLKEGDFFGHLPLLSDKAYENSASCISDCCLRIIPKTDFTLLLYNNKDFAAKFIKLVSNRVLETEKKMIDLAYSSVRKKVANSLVHFAKNLGLEESEKIVIKTTREELAALAGTAKETLIRTISDFKSEGLVSVDGKNIIINDLEELEDLMA